jgi:hypothetical protein
MTPSLADPSAKKVDELGKNEKPDKGTAKSSNIPSGPSTESEASTAHVESSSPESDFSDDEPGLRPGYTRRLIKKKYCPPEMWDVNFDEEEWIKKAYGENVIVVDLYDVPDGWILVDGISCHNNLG